MPCETQLRNCRMLPARFDPSLDFSSAQLITATTEAGACQLSGVMEAPDSPSPSHEFKIAAPSLALGCTWYLNHHTSVGKSRSIQMQTQIPGSSLAAYTIGRGCMETCTSGELQMDLFGRHALGLNTVKDQLAMSMTTSTGAI